jgi:NAD(P)-dependent dehydrogenase (short-subunit alcohol dehydrogenase family)
LRHAGRAAVVTGAARSFGYAIAGALAASGASVAAVDRESFEPPACCSAFVADVSDESAVSALRADCGPCDILVNIAGVNFARPFADLDYESWRGVQRVNLDSQFLMAKAFSLDMVEKGWGRIVNMASSSIYTSTPGLTAYMASKAGALGLTSGLANDLGPHGITVNAVSPGLTRTPAVDADIRSGVFPEAVFDAMAEQTALRRTSEVADLVGTVLYLTSDDAAFVTARFIVADGGATRTF